MKKSNNVLLATSILIALHSTPAWSDINQKNMPSETQDEISRLQKKISNNYEDIKSINDLGVIHLKLGNYDEAIAQFKKSLEVVPAYTLGPFFSGNIYTDEENYQEKINEFQEIIKANREYARAHNYIGLAYLQQKNHSTAKQSLLESIKINPKYVQAHNNLGVLYEEMGETDKAIESYQTAYKVDSGNPDSLFNLGLAYDSMGEGEKSVHYMVLAKKAHEKKFGKEGIGRINNKVDQLWAKYSDNTENESIASLDSNLTADTDGSVKTSENQPVITSVSTFNTPDNYSTKNINITSQTPKTLAVNLKPEQNLTTLSIAPVSESQQGETNDELIFKNSVKDLKIKKEDGSTVVAALPEKKDSTSEPIIKEMNVTDSKGSYSYPGSSTVGSKKMTAIKPKKSTWVSDWVFDYPK
ncbi:MAG: tetratricopeptide repeat protein [Opitutae bacterium]|nr:tetratricopeptide repeat protein [Opitutae bacterium]